MYGMLAAIGFLTRIPVPVRVFGSTDAKSRSLAWYPVVGAVIGLILVGLAWLMRDQPPLLAGALLLVAWVALTGAMHLDGFADSADAWVGGLGDRERTLAIMKDPRCGPAGVVSVVLLLLVKAVALASLAPTGWQGLLLAPVLARTALVAAFVAVPYVRDRGLGSALVDAPRWPCSIALVLATVGCLWLGGWPGLWAWLGSIVTFGLWWLACRKRLGGMTGDTCGALTELIEAVVLVVWVTNV